jgi:hypothetical protein
MDDRDFLHNVAPYTSVILSSIPEIASKFTRSTPPNPLEYKVEDLLAKGPYIIIRNL